ncbi:hypothetical protein I317_06872 [Kwoniella heveanensis CBS 569]|uniref:Pentatricopeptide repeat-containing protein-mitochondrial domain-containing protein n=1 Tax=Kwoniella heveanensis BCC8398 TaxID=1296120 RepID=A0A1B9H1Y7_9TREE|nr:hypothetical protein I316_01190 [Kwoniella heveanensis BCC8398]OCF39337.1 hypothetical protein I317_06872 [Kwoniella heveanensis CBS 569]
MSFCQLCRTARVSTPFARGITTSARAAATELPPKRTRGPLPKLGRQGDPTQSLPELLKKLTDLKGQSRRPRPAAYIAVIKAAGDFSLSRSSEGNESENLGWQVALAAWEDAKKGGLDLGSEGFESLLRFTVIYPHLLHSLLLYSNESISSSFQNLTRAAASNSNPEQMIYLLHSMFAQRVTPTPATIKNAIRLACEWGYARLALQLAEQYETQSSSGRRVELSAWVDILSASAESQYLHGVETAWNRVKSGYTPDEGLIIAMLNTAGRWGRPDFASTMLERLPNPQERHLSPLLEAFCNAGQVPNAFHVLASIRDAGLTPTMATVQPITAVLTNTEVIDQAFYALEDMHKAGQPIDITALNALIDASARLGDLQRARATQTAAADLGLTPSVDTFNLVLECCVKSQYRPLGDTILSEMAAQDISPDASTYEALIRLCLSQPAYEDAFYYLEKAKGDGFKPSYAVYEALIRKCMTMNDSRWRLVAEELTTVGYKIESDLHEFINSGGKRNYGSRSAEKGRRRANDQMVGSKRRQWIKDSATSAPDTSAN